MTRAAEERFGSVAKIASRSSASGCQSRAAEERTADLRADAEAVRATLAEAAQAIGAAFLYCEQSRPEVLRARLRCAQVAIARADCALLALGRPD